MQNSRAFYLSLSQANRKPHQTPPVTSPQNACSCACGSPPGIQLEVAQDSDFNYDETRNNKATMPDKATQKNSNRQVHLPPTDPDDERESEPEYDRPDPIRLMLNNSKWFYRNLKAETTTSSHQPYPNRQQQLALSKEAYAIPPQEFVHEDTLSIVTYNIGNASYTEPGIFSSEGLLGVARPSLFLIQEHGFKASPPNLKGYECLVNGRSCIFINANIPFHREREIECNLSPLECVCVSIPTSNRKPYLLISLYSSPNLPPSSILKLQKLSRRRNLIIGGDFNSPGQVFGCSHPTSRGRALDRLAAADQLVLVNDPSEITHLDRSGGQDRCLDGFLLSQDIAALAEAEVICSWTVSDHLPVHLRSQIPIPCREDAKTTIFSIKDFTKAIAKSNLGETAKGYLDAIDSAISKATLPAKSTRAILNDWFNDACRKAKRRKSKALSSLVKARKCPSKTESRDFLDKFRLVRSAARDTFRSAKIAYRKSLFEGLGEHVSGKAAWSAIRRCIGGRWTRRKTPQAPLTMQLTLANRLSNQFCSIRNSPDVTAFALPSEQALPAEADPIEEWEVQEAIRKLRDKSAPGADGITVPMLKILFKCNPHRLTQTLNELLLDFDRYKHEIVRAIPKDGGDFRPIALLSQLGKLIERVISWRITRILRNQPQITERQFGCRTGNRVQDSATLLQHTAVQSGKNRLQFYLMQERPSTDLATRK